MDNRGQIILILLLLITVGLGIGLSIIQRSLSDVSTSSKVEQSSRAFSAAEAGIERVLSGGQSNFQLESSQVSVDNKQIPDPGQALEYPITKEEIAHFWLVSPADLASEAYPSNSSLNIYWGEVGSSTSDSPAIELSFIYKDTSGNYKNKKFFYDLDGSRRANNGFSDPGSCAHSPISTSISPTAKSFRCKVTINTDVATFPALSQLMILRARVLYTAISSPVALQSATSKSLPKQARVLTSIGTVGDVQRRVQLIRVDKVVPFFFDYAIFSAGEISKSK